MRTKQHRIMAFSLALLVLISTTGFSMNMMFCNCTGKQYLAVLVTKLNLDCCKAELEKATKSCCKDASVKCKHTNNNNGSTVLADKDCCSSVFKWTKANINLDLTQELKLPIAHPLTLVNYAYWKPIVHQTTDALFPVEISLINTPNKAPPQFGYSFQNWFQIYRC